MNAIALPLSSRIYRLPIPMVMATTSPTREASTPDENAEFVELARKAFADSRQSSANSTNSSGGYEHPAIFPADSVLADWMDFARRQEESADAFLVGSILPLCAALLARRVWFTWGSKREFPNLFVMLAGKPGDRKSSVIMQAMRLSKMLLPVNAFLPKSFSPEAMFDAYTEDSGGRPDKLWIVDDANGTLTDWQKSTNGERVATRFLELYDCTGLSESFQRNKNVDPNGNAAREVPETSTSLLFGATFNIACFQGQSVRGGMARRFLFYVAERHGRLIVRPHGIGGNELERLANRLRPLAEGPTGPMDFTPEADAIWAEYQHMNRQESNDTDSMREAELARLSSSPMQTLHVAMIFEACRWAARGGHWTGLIAADTLRCAIEHVAACLTSADRLDGIGNRAQIAEDSEVFLAKVRHRFAAVDGFHFATRSDLTKHFCPNGGRPGSWRPNDLYLRFIPALERRNEARLVDKTGKRKTYAFRAEANF